MYEQLQYNAKIFKNVNLVSEIKIKVKTIMIKSLTLNSPISFPPIITHTHTHKHKHMVEDYG